MPIFGRMVFPALVLLPAILLTACTPGLPPGCAMVSLDNDSESRRLDCSAQTR